MSKIEQLNQRYANDTGEDVIKGVLAHARNPIATSKFGPNAEAFIKQLVKFAPDLPIVWIDVVFDNQAFRQNMQLLRKKYSLNVITVCAPMSVVEKYQGTRLPEYGCAEFTQFQQDIKVNPFEAFLQQYQPDYWFTDIRQGESSDRQSLAMFSAKGESVIKVAPFALTTSYKRTQYTEHADRFNDVCKPNLNMECGLHLGSL